MHNLRHLMTALAVASVVATGCTNSSTTLSSDGGPGDGSSSDAKGDGETGKGDAKAETGASDAGGDCAFADFVIGLINKDTNATAAPSTDLGASLEDSQQQSCFKSLFP
jgi:hypothetical protein